MVQCMSFSKSSSESGVAVSPTPTINLRHPPPCKGDGTPKSSSSSSSGVQSPRLNLTREYTLALQSQSYSEMWSRYHDHDDPPCLVHPDRHSVEDALTHAKPTSLTRLLSTYFDHSENTTSLCLLLHHSVYRARALYAPLYTLLDLLPPDLHSLSHSQSHSALDRFLHFLRLDNPFPDPASHNFHDMRRCFSLLRHQLDLRLTKSQSRITLIRRAAAGSAICVIGSVLVVIASAAAIGAHALVAFIATPVCSLAYLPSKMTKKELAHVKQLEAARRGAYVLNSDLDTIDKLVYRLYMGIESDKVSIRLGLEGDRDRHSTSEVLKQLRRNKEKFLEELQEIEERICLCLSAVNKTRSLLLQEIMHLHQSSQSTTS